MCIGTQLSFISHLQTVSRQKLNIYSIYRLNGPRFVVTPTQVSSIESIIILLSPGDVHLLTILRIQHRTDAWICGHSPGSRSFHVTATNATRSFARRPSESGIQSTTIMVLQWHTLRQIQFNRF